MERSIASLPPTPPHRRRPSSAAAPASSASPSGGDAEDIEAAADPDDDSTNGEIPLTMAASVLLAELPRDASVALASVGGFAAEKVVVRFKAVGAAPSLAQELCKISATRKFEEVVRYLRRKLRCRDTDSVFLYVNSVFAPSLDEVVGNLHRCFKNAQDQLVVAYAMTPAFG